MHMGRVFQRLKTRFYRRISLGLGTLWGPTSGFFLWPTRFRTELGAHEPRRTHGRRFVDDFQNKLQHLVFVGRSQKVLRPNSLSKPSNRSPTTWRLGRCLWPTGPMTSGRIGLGASTAMPDVWEDRFGGSGAPKRLSLCITGPHREGSHLKGYQWAQKAKIRSRNRCLTARTPRRPPCSVALGKPQYNSTERPFPKAYAAGVFV